MPAAPKKAVDPVPVIGAGRIQTIAEIYRREDWHALCRQVDLLIGEVARQQRRSDVLEAALRE